MTDQLDPRSWWRVYVTGTGQRIECIHRRFDCRGRSCVIHNPSDHPMRAFPTHWRQDRRIMERICPHGIGHPDPDGLYWQPDVDMVHGCDGCCHS